MKSLINIFYCLVPTLFLTACSSNYLDTVPENETGSATVFETTEIAAMAVNGLAKLMNSPFYYPNQVKPSTADFNGEGTIKMIYGNWMGNHFVCSNKNGFGVLFKGTNYMSNTASIYCYYPWWYYYMIIGNANTVVTHIAGAEGLESERQRIEAQGRVFRAYAYMMLSQIYCKRWSDSDNGKSAGLVLRLKDSYDPQKLSTLAELYKQIYDDLDEAIRLFKLSGYTRDTKDNHLPDLQVASAIYARAALNRTDYQTAATKAKEAKEGVVLMDVNAYKSRFNAPTSEWIWSSRNTGTEAIGQFSFFAKIAYDSQISEASKTKCISRELFNRIPGTDIRRNLFLNPGTMTYSSTSGVAGKELAAYARAQMTDMLASMPVYAYMQFKFKTTDKTGGGDLCHIRASEMYLVQAEAEYFLENEKTARELLVALNKESGRNPVYACDKTGQALLDEIKLYRAIELWGEGFDWFDMKRWGDTIVRNAFDKGGNFTSQTGFTTTPDENNAWCWLIPQIETDYNPEIEK